MTKLPEALRKKLEAKSKEYAAGLIQPPVARFDFMQGAQECHELLAPLIKEAREHREGLQRDNRCLEEALCNQGIDAGYAEEKLNKEITALKASLETTERRRQLASDNELKLHDTLESVKAERDAAITAMDASINSEMKARGNLETAVAALEKLSQGYDSPFSDDIAQEALNKIRKDGGV